MSGVGTWTTLPRRWRRGITRGHGRLVDSQSVLSGSLRLLSLTVVVRVTDVSGTTTGLVSKLSAK